MTRYRLDSSTRLVGDGTSMLGGSPLRLFRLTDGGRTMFDRMSAGDAVPSTRLTERLLDAGAIHPLARPADTHRFAASDVTVVVPTHDDRTSRLADILGQCAGTAAVVFVDDGSASPISGVHGATVVRLRHNGGPGAARNAGRRAAKTPLVAFVDSDVELHGGWLDGLLGHFDDDTVGLVAPRVASGAASPGGDPGVARYEERHSPLDLGTAPARIAPGTRVSYVPAAAIVVRVAALDAIDGFDTTLRWGEDVDAVWRLAEAGWRCRYEPAVVVEHQPRRSWRALSLQRAAYGESAASLAAAHGNAVAPVRMSPWTLAVWLLAAAGHVVAALGLVAMTSVALIAKLPGVPATESIKIAGHGHLAAGQLLATAVRRTWLPIVGLASISSGHARRVAVVALLPALLDGGPPRLLDDVAYGVGVWKGVLTQRRLDPLLPVLAPWPARHAAFPGHALNRLRSAWPLPRWRSVARTIARAVR